MRAHLPPVVLAGVLATLFGPMAAATSVAPTAALAPADDETRPDAPAAEKAPDESPPAGPATQAPTDAAAEAKADAASEAAKAAEARRLLREYARVNRTMGARMHRGPTLEAMNAKDALKLLGDLGNFGVVFDPVLREQGLDLESRVVSLEVKGIAYEDALMLILPPEYGYKIGPGYVLITTLEKSWQPLPVRTYSIQLTLATVPNFVGPRFDPGDVSSRGGSSGPMIDWQTIMDEPEVGEDQATPGRVIDLIQKHVTHVSDRRIAPWEAEGGPATIEYFQGRLVISQTEYGHRMIRRLLSKIE